MAVPVRLSRGQVLNLILPLAQFITVTPRLSARCFASHASRLGDHLGDDGVNSTAARMSQPSGGLRGQGHYGQEWRRPSLPR